MQTKLLYKTAGFVDSGVKFAQPKAILLIIIYTCQD